ncbi:MAG TPA: hypothetical protein VKS20_08565 [Candidatus Acidoferrales bacterium]|nr:hypothetical protein [Candidatus Acidoferrales bacterium]
MAQPQREESQPRSAGHESIDGTMSGSVLQFGLASELDGLHRDEAWLHPTGRSSKTLYALFEATGNESTERRGVLDAIDELTRAGMLDECGSDFYALTEKGKGQSLSF